MPNIGIISFFVLIMLTLVWTISPAFADSWYVGKGLKQGDYFRYNVCYIEYHNCSPLEIGFWVKNQSSTSHDYFIQMLAIEGNNIQKGTIMTTPDTPIPVYSDTNISNYSNVYKDAILWLANTASFPNGRDFNSPLWSHNGVAESGFGPIGQEKITIQSGSYDTWVIGWANTTRNNGGTKIWVVPSMPFPVKGIMSTYSINGISQLGFNFELLEAGNSQSIPPQFFNSVPTPNFSSILPPPLKQFERGFPSHDIKCNQGLVLLINTAKGFPVCVKVQTAHKLVERGWGFLTT